jgi:hypothetical protein
MTTEQKKLVEGLAEVNGFRSVSSFVRAQLIKSDLVVKRLNEIKKMLEP